jgi:hypothetical protein
LRELVAHEIELLLVVVARVAELLVHPPNLGIDVEQLLVQLGFALLLGHDFVPVGDAAEPAEVHRLLVQVVLVVRELGRRELGRGTARNEHEASQREGGEDGELHLEGSFWYTLDRPVRSFA